MGKDGRPRGVVVVMGVSGCGKSTIGPLLAEKLGVSYAEADDFHPPANIAKMAAGQPLDDDDRYPWLAAIVGWIRDRSRAGEGGVVSCSALKRRYRDMLCGAGSQVSFLHLTVGRAHVVERVAERSKHFMPVSLVDSQFQALEPLQPDEPGVVVDASATPGEIVREVAARLSGAGAV